MQKSSSWTLSFWRTGFQLAGFLHRKVDRCSVVRIIGSWSFKALLGRQKLHSSLIRAHARHRAAQRPAKALGEQSKVAEHSCTFMRLPKPERL